MKAKRQIEIAKIMGDFNLNFFPNYGALGNVHLTNAIGYHIRLSTRKTI